MIKELSRIHYNIVKADRTNHKVQNLASYLSHCRWKCHYHIVFIHKYRRHISYEQICISMPPKYSVSQFVGYLKGKSALMVDDKHPEKLNK